MLVLSGSCLLISSMTMVALVPDGPVAKVDGAVRRLRHVPKRWKKRHCGGLPNQLIFSVLA